MTIGFIKLHRKLIEWEWYSDVNVCRVFLHLLITANFEDKKWRGINIKRGEQVSSYDNIAKATNLSKQQIRTALTKLKSTHELTVTSTSHYTIFTLTNYTVYQDRKNDINTPSTHGATNEQQTSNIPSTTTKEGKESKEDKKKEISDQFESFWNLYSKKTAKADAEKKFNSALKKDSFESIISGLNQYVKSRGEDSKFWKNPSTWLNQECWKDEYSSSTPTGESKFAAYQHLKR